MKNESITILGVRVDKVDMKEALLRFSSFLDGNECNAIFTPNPEIIYDAQNKPELIALLNSSALSIPDGMAIVKASETLGAPLSERVTGIDFSRAALEICAEKNKKVFFLGAKPGVAKLAAENLSSEIPGLLVAGYADGYFTDEQAIVNLINDSGADFVLVALGAPKQEKFISDHKSELRAKVCIGIGGSFDVWSGSIDRAPDFFISHNIEWLYRLIKEPKRLGRIAKVPRFLKLVEKQAKAGRN